MLGLGNYIIYVAPAMVALTEQTQAHLQELCHMSTKHVLANLEKLGLVSKGVCDLILNDTLS